MSQRHRQGRSCVAAIATSVSSRRRMIASTTQHDPITSRRGGVEPGIVDALVDPLGHQRAEHLVGVGASE